jgi:hypothetical protein
MKRRQRKQVATPLRAKQKGLMNKNSAGYKDMIILGEKSRIYFDLNEREAKWLRGIANAFGLTIEEFTRRLHRGKLPRPPYPYRQAERGARRDLSLFKVTCRDAGIWKQLSAIARHEREPNAENICVEAIFSFLEMFNDDLLFDPRTGEVLCEVSEITALESRVISE